MTDAVSLALAKRLREEVGISESYAFHLAHGQRDPSDALAIKIYRLIGVKLGSIENATDEEIDMLERLKGVAA